jgi:hypothetical protein
MLRGYEAWNVSRQLLSTLGDSTPPPRVLYKALNQIFSPESLAEKLRTRVYALQTELELDSCPTEEAIDLYGDRLEGLITGLKDEKSDGQGKQEHDKGGKGKGSLKQAKAKEGKGKGSDKGSTPQVKGGGKGDKKKPEDQTKGSKEGKGKSEGGRSEGKGKGKSKGKEDGSSNRVCHFFNTQEGSRRGGECRYSHVKAATKEDEAERRRMEISQAVDASVKKAIYGLFQGQEEIPAAFRAAMMKADFTKLVKEAAYVLADTGASHVTRKMKEGEVLEGKPIHIELASGATQGVLTAEDEIVLPDGGELFPLGAAIDILDMKLVWDKKECLLIGGKDGPVRMKTFGGQPYLTRKEFD